MFIFDAEKCNACGTCTKGCHGNALSWVDGVLTCDEAKCNGCGHCLALCPCDAIMIDGDGYDIEEVEEFDALTKATPKQIRRNIMMRRSVRSFNEEEVTDAELAYIIESAKYAPTAMNKQDNALLVMQDPEEKKILMEKSMEEVKKMAENVAEKAPGLSKFFMSRYNAYKETGEDSMWYGAPVVIYVFASSLQNGSICAATMAQMAESLGLGTCYVQMPTDPFNNSPELMKEYEIPEGLKCVIALCVGHTDEEYFCSVPRKDLAITWK